MAGFGFGKAAVNIENSFLAHQKEMYFATFGSQLRAYQETQPSCSPAQASLLTLVFSVAGVLFGVTYLRKNAGALQLIKEELRVDPRRNILA